MDTGFKLLAMPQCTTTGSRAAGAGSHGVQDCASLLQTQSHDVGAFFVCFLSSSLGGPFFTSTGAEALGRSTDEDQHW